MIRALAGALLAFLLVPSTAMALTSDRAGGFLEGGGGIALAAPPFAADPGWEARIGGWWGRTDDAYAIGRYTAIGAGAQAAPGGRIAAVIELRRGFDVIVIGPHMFLAGGATLGPGEPGWLGEFGGGVKARLRFSGPYVGYQLRARLGASGGPDGIVGTAAITLGVALSAPFDPAPEPR